MRCYIAMVIMTVLICGAHSLYTYVEMDNISQAACLAMGRYGIMTAVRKGCQSAQSNVTCEQRCMESAASLKELTLMKSEINPHCIGVFYFFGKRNPLVPLSKPMEPHMAMFRYGRGGCNVPGCGPVYCCCRHAM